MQNYTNEYSKFPEAVIETKEYQDADDTVASMINTIKQYQAKGQYDAAASYIQKNKEFLSKCLIGASVLMQLQEHIRNTQIYALKQGQNIHCQTAEPEVMAVGDAWIGG